MSNDSTTDKPSRDAVSLALRESTAFRDLEHLEQSIAAGSRPPSFRIGSMGELLGWALRAHGIEASFFV